MRLDQHIKALAAAQHSCVAVWQLRALGATPTEIARLRRSPAWAEAGRRVLRLAGSPPTDLQAASIAVLAIGPGGALSHGSAAALWGLGAAHRLLPAQVFRAYAESTVGSIADLGRAHRLRGIDGAWVTVLRDVQVVRPELCVYQLCGSVDPRRAERALDRAWSLGLVSGRSLRCCLAAFAKQGRNGTTVLRALLQERGDDYVPPASGLERRFQDLATDSGVRGLRRQVDVGDDDAWVGRVDFAHDEVPLLVEVQSALHHAALSYRRDDAGRIERLRAGGYVVLEVWDVDVWHDPASVAASLRHAFRRARALRAA